jgi:hypothetical protein
VEEMVTKGQCSKLVGESYLSPFPDESVKGV